MEDVIKKLCICGCGRLVRLPQHRFINGHNAAFRPGYSQRNKSSQLCSCGCGQMTSPGKTFINHHHTPFEHPAEEILIKMRRPRSEKGRANMVLAMNRPEVKEKISGENSYLWRGGIKYPYSQDWTNTLKEAIRQRDKYRCQICSIKQEEMSEKLAVHHIDYSTTNCDPDNLISLCRSCHAKTNYKREKWQHFLTEEKSYCKIIKVIYGRRHS